MTAFSWEGIQCRVVFGAGSTDQIATEIERTSARRVMLVSTPGRAALVERVGAILGDAVVARFGEAVVHVPEATATAARTAATISDADCILALGGGASIGVAKAVALTSGLPIVAIPTTYSGSEMTSVWGITGQGTKQTGRTLTVQPRVVIYDPLLTLDLAPQTAAASGMNALAHCLEALYAPDSNPVTTLVASEGIRVLALALPEIVHSPSDLGPRENALMGAWLAGMALGAVSMGLHHKLCHTLGGSFGLPHAETHAAMLPFTAAFNSEAAPIAMRIAADALSVDSAGAVPARILALVSGLGMPRSLRELGIREDDIDRASRLAVEKQYPNPRAVTLAAIHKLLTAAYHGDEHYINNC